MTEIFHFLKFYDFINKLEENFLLGKWNHRGFFLCNRIFGRKALKIYISSPCMWVYSINEWRHLSVNLSLLSRCIFMLSNIFRLLRTLSITLILDQWYMCCSMKVQNNSRCKYLAYSLGSYYLSLIWSGI